MYRCKDCGAIFSDPKEERWYETHGELDTGNKTEIRYIYHCPECYGTMYENVYECEACHDGWATSDYCPRCMKKATEAVESLQKAIGTNWQTAVDLIGAWYERNW